MLQQFYYSSAQEIRNKDRDRCNVPHPLRLLYIPSTYCVIVELELFTIKSVLFAVVNFVSNGCFYCDYLFMTFLYKECERFNYHFAPHRRNKGLTFRFFASSLVGQF